MTENEKQLLEQAMRRAIQIAEYGRYKTAPNPTVGAVLFTDAFQVAEGFHAEYGTEHAEVDCIINALSKNIDTVGATLVVTLEPCNHHGKTPPCTQAILDAKIKRVIIGSKDPNPVAMGGAEFLRENGVEVIEGFMQEECDFLIRDYLTWIEKKRPYVILKMATSLDGKIATKEGLSSYITGEEARLAVAQLRAQVGCANGIVLVGNRTFTLDNPKLSARDIECEKQPKAAILTNSLPSLQEKSNHYLLEERMNETIFLTNELQAKSKNASEIIAAGAKVYALDNTKDLNALCTTLFEKEKAPYILCEGGSRLAYSLLQAQCVDEYRQYIAPMIFADNEALNVAEGRKIEKLDEVFKFDILSLRKIGKDVEIISKVLYN